MPTQPTGWLADLPPRLAAQLRFLTEADRLKSVLRANRLADGSRHENTAEHSWHVALFAIVLSEWSDQPVDAFRVVKMLILHDLVEIECGDTPLYEADQVPDLAEREAAAAEKLFGLLPAGQDAELRGLWQEFESAESADARFAKALDRLQPILLNHLGRGGTWADYNVDEDRVREKTGRIQAGSAELWRAAERIFAEAVHEGWLKPAAGAD